MSIFFRIFAARKQNAMYTLRDFQKITYAMPVPERWDGNIFCLDTDGELTLRTNITQGFLSAYSFTIVLEGWLTLQYNGEELALRKGDMFIYLPGLSVTILETSADYRGICLIADEGYTLELPVVRTAIRTAYFPVLEFGNPRLALHPDDSRHLEQLMRLAFRYLHSQHPLADESLRLLYSLFLADLSAIEDRSVPAHRFSPRIEELFLRFFQLLPQHFVEHRDIGFYADRLCITTTYLSRIVRQVSGRTVTDYIDQMLLMEAVWLLQTTPFSVAQIADRLHFADTTTFARFFKRMKGCTPKEYRINNTAVS